MYFLWPSSLWLLAVLAALPFGYVWLLRRRARQAVRYSQVALVKSAAEGRQWRRHIPPALFLVACAVLVVGAARPMAKVPLPWARTSIMLAVDVSLSMRVNDVKPTRIAAAQESVKLFLKDLPRDIEVGLVTFAGSAQVAQRVTPDRDALLTAVDGIQMQFGTAIGSGLVLSLAELFPDAGIALDPNEGTRRRGGRSLDDQQPKVEPRPFTPVAPGSFDSAAIILLSDGRRTTGVDTLAAAKMAADRGVRVHVVALGGDGTASTPEGLPIYMQLDEPTLKEVARMTGGEYHHATSAENLTSVYKALGSRVQVIRRETELAALFALVASLLMIAAASLSLRWRGPL